jgi:hypothetical protein
VSKSIPTIAVTPLFSELVADTPQICSEGLSTPEKIQHFKQLTNEPVNQKIEELVLFENERPKTPMTFLHFI